MYKMFVKLQNCIHLTQLIICKIKFLKIHKNKKIARILIKLRKKAYSYSLFLLFFYSIQILWHFYGIEERERECQINGLPESLIEPG